MVFKRKSREELEKNTAYYTKRNEEREELAKARQEHRREKYKRVIATSQKVYSGAATVGKAVTTQPPRKKRTYKVYKPATRYITGTDRPRTQVRRARPRTKTVYVREAPPRYTSPAPKRRRKKRRRSSSQGMFDLPRF